MSVPLEWLVADSSFRTGGPPSHILDAHCPCRNRFFRLSATLRCAQPVELQLWLSTRFWLGVRHNHQSKPRNRGTKGARCMVRVKSLSRIVEDSLLVAISRRNISSPRAHFLISSSSIPRNVQNRSCHHPLHESLRFRSLKRPFIVVSHCSFGTANYTNIMNALYQPIMDRLAIRFDQLSLDERPETQVPWTWKFSSKMEEPYGTPVATPRHGRRDNPLIPPPEDDIAKKLLLLLLQGPNHRKRSTKQLKG
jgi:hypothetical protein